jgi:hypothetical protein
MTTEEQIQIIAEFHGTTNRFVIMRRGLYYRLNAGGYTSDIEKAWILPEEEARKYEYPHDDPITIHPAPLPDYEKDLNVVREVEMLLWDTDMSLGEKYILCLRKICERQSYYPEVAPISFRLEALVETIKGVE